MRLLFLVFFLVTSSCSNLFYYPNNINYYSPAALGLSPEDQYFLNQKGEKIHGWWIESKIQPSKGTIIFFHGNAENLTSHFVQLSWLPENGYSYFIFDYPEFGQSEGRARTENVVKTSMEALRWVHRHKDQRPLVVYGQSLGGIVSMKVIEKLKTEIPIRTLILDSTFPSYQKIAKYKMSRTWLSWILQPLTYVLISDEYSPEKLSEFPAVPKLVIVCEEDQIVEPFWGSEIYEQISGPKEIWKVPKANHIQTYWVDNKSYRPKLLEFLKKTEN